MVSEEVTRRSSTWTLRSRPCWSSPSRPNCVPRCQGKPSWMLSSIRPSLGNLPMKPLKRWLFYPVRFGSRIRLCCLMCPRLSVDIWGTSWDQCRSMVQYSFTSRETRRLVRMDSPGQPPWLSHTSWTMMLFSPRHLSLISVYKQGYKNGEPSYETFLKVDLFTEGSWAW